MTAQPDASVSADGVFKAISEVVRDVLGREDIDSTVDLFDQGTTSLAFIRIVAQLNENYGIALDVAALEEASVLTLTSLVNDELHSKGSLGVRD